MMIRTKVGGKNNCVVQVSFIHSVNKIKFEMLKWEHLRNLADSSVHANLKSDVRKSVILAEWQ